MGREQPGQPHMDPVVDCAAYAAGTRASALAMDQIQPALARDDQFVWIGLYEPDQSVLRQVQEQFGLHDLAIEDAINAHQRPKLELYEDSLFVVLRTAQRAASGRLEFGETHVFLGRNYIVTVRHGSMRSHVGVRQRCEATPQLLAQGPGYVLYALMDFIVDQYLPIVRQIEDEVQSLESIVLGDPAGVMTPPAMRRPASTCSSATWCHCAGRCRRWPTCATGCCASIFRTSRPIRGRTSATSTTTSSG